MRWLRIGLAISFWHSWSRVSFEYRVIQCYKLTYQLAFRPWDDIRCVIILRMWHQGTLTNHPSGMLTFTVYHLLKNPDAMRKLRDEIDTKIGARRMTVHDVHKLPYLIGIFDPCDGSFRDADIPFSAVMRESLRLSPTAPLRNVTPLEDTTLKGGKYFVEKGLPIIVAVVISHHDPKIWGPDVRYGIWPLIWMLTSLVGRWIYTWTNVGRKIWGTSSESAL